MFYNSFIYTGTSPQALQTSQEEKQSIQIELEEETSKNITLNKNILTLLDDIMKKDDEISSLKKENEKLKKNKPFTVESVRKNKTNEKDLFKHYAGITYLNFCILLNLLVKVEPAFSFKRVELRSVSHETGLFLTLCRLRRGFSLADLAFRFSITMNSAGDLFNT